MRDRERQLQLDADIIFDAKASPTRATPAFPPTGWCARSNNGRTIAAAVRFDF